MANNFVERSNQNLDDLEKEIAELEKQYTSGNEQSGDNTASQDTGTDNVEEKTSQEVVSTTSEEDNLNPEEKTFKKRYGDLRRHSTKEKETLSAKIAELEEKLKASASTDVPTDEEEIKRWAETNPKAAAIVKALAKLESDKTANDLKQKMETIEKDYEEVTRDKQKAKILKTHSDFDELTANDKFHDWAEKQPKRVQDALYDGDADDVIWAINLYKTEQLARTANPQKEAARQVDTKTRTNPPGDGKGRRFSESQVDRMTNDEYQKNEAAIDQAIKDGNFDYDLSGAR